MGSLQRNRILIFTEWGEGIMETINGGFIGTTKRIHSAIPY